MHLFGSPAQQLRIRKNRARGRQKPSGLIAAQQDKKRARRATLWFAAVDFSPSPLLVSFCLSLKRRRNVGKKKDTRTFCPLHLLCLWGGSSHGFSSYCVYACSRPAAPAHAKKTPCLRGALLFIGQIAGVSSCQKPTNKDVCYSKSASPRARRPLPSHTLPTTVPLALDKFCGSFAFVVAAPVAEASLCALPTARPTSAQR
jgi:hypothetical protein